MDSPAPPAHHRQHGRGRRAKDYLPLGILIAAAFIAALAMQAAFGKWATRSWMLDGMGLFLVILSLFKFFDIPGFVDGFRMYDLLARRIAAYGYLYPFIELALGLGYLARWHPPVVYGATIAVMLFGTAGVVRSLARGLDVECACMGTALHVPLSTVTLAEDVGMAVMAAAMWFIPV
jgi:hypothetical protein